MTDTLKSTYALLNALNLEAQCDYIKSLYNTGKADRARSIFNTLSREKQLDAMIYFASCFGGHPLFTHFIADLSN